MSQSKSDAELSSGRVVRLCCPSAFPCERRLSRRGKGCCALWWQLSENVVFHRVQTSKPGDVIHVVLGSRDADARHSWALEMDIYDEEVAQVGWSRNREEGRCWTISDRRRFAFRIGFPSSVRKTEWLFDAGGYVRGLMLPASVGRLCDFGVMHEVRVGIVDSSEVEAS